MLVKVVTVNLMHGLYMRTHRNVYCTCLAPRVLMSMALGRGTARCRSLSACPRSSPPGPRIDYLAWPNRRRGARPGKVNMEKKRHILSCPERRVEERGRERMKERGEKQSKDRKSCAKKLGFWEGRKNSWITQKRINRVTIMSLQSPKPKRTLI